MTLSEVEELCRYWADHPPLHVLAGALLGRKRRSAEPAAAPRGTEWLLAELGPGFAAGTIQRDLPPVVLDFEQLRIKAASEAAGNG